MANGIAIDRQRMRNERLRRGWSLRQLSDRTAELGKRVDHGNYAKYETGALKPEPQNLALIAKALGLDVTELALPMDDLDDEDDKGDRAA